MEIMVVMAFILVFQLKVQRHDLFLKLAIVKDHMLAQNLAPFFSFFGVVFSNLFISFFRWWRTDLLHES